MLARASSGLWAITCLWPGSKGPFTVAEERPAGQAGHPPAELCTGCPREAAGLSCYCPYAGAVMELAQADALRSGFGKQAERVRP